MHAQIKQVIQSIRLQSEDKMWVNLSAGQHTPLGRILYYLYYRSSLLDCLFIRNEFSGYPHNGGEHTLKLHTRPKDIIDFLEILKEIFLELNSWTDEEQQILMEMSLVSQEIRMKLREVRP